MLIVFAFKFSDCGGILDLLEEKYTKYLVFLKHYYGWHIERESLISCVVSIVFKK